MTTQDAVKMIGILFLATAFATTSVGLSSSSGEEAAEGVIVGVPEKEQPRPKPVPAEETAEAVIVGVPVGEQVEGGAIRALPPLKGPKKSIAVLDFDNRANFAGQWKLGEGMADMLTTALVKTNRFMVVERPRIKQILKEQDLAASGRTVKAEGARIGKLIPAQIGVMGAITEFSFKQQETGLDFGFKHVAAGFVTGAAHIGLNLRMIDTTTGQILASDRVEKKATYTGIKGAYTNKDFAIGGGHFQETPLGKATQQALHEAVYKVAMNMQKVPWQGRIVLVQGERIVINCGKREGIVPGQQFIVFSKGEELTDPETGEILGSEEARAGRISAVQILDKYCYARAEEGQGFKRGDILRLP